MSKQPSMFTAADELSPIIGEELAQAFCDHRKALRKPLIPHAAQLIARKLRAMRDPIAAIEKAIEHGWLTVYPETPTTYSIRAPRGLAAVTETFMQELAEDGYRNESQESRAPRDDARLPLLAGPDQHRHR